MGIGIEPRLGTELESVDIVKMGCDTLFRFIHLCLQPILR